MRTYVVQAGDSPARIAGRDDMAGCQRCARDLVLANAHKPTIKHSNGFLSFRDLSVGETLWIPDKWFSGELDKLSPEYFAALPHPDGVTLSKAQRQAGIVGDEAPSNKEGLSKGAIVVMSLLSIGAVVGAFYGVLAYPPRRRVRRIKEEVN